MYAAITSGCTESDDKRSIHWGIIETSGVWNVLEVVFWKNRVCFVSSFWFWKRHFEIFLLGVKFTKVDAKIGESWKNILFGLCLNDSQVIFQHFPTFLCEYCFWNCLGVTLTKVCSGDCSQEMWCWQQDVGDKMLLLKMLKTSIMIV